MLNITILKYNRIIIYYIILVDIGSILMYSAKLLILNLIIMKISIEYIERPFIIYNNRIYHKIPDHIEIYKGKLFYHFIMYNNKKVIYTSNMVYLTKKEADLNLIN